jgi:hypothetical protein
MNLTVVSSDNTAIGYGRHGMKLAAALRNLGVDVQHTPTGRLPERKDPDVLFVTLPSMVEQWWEGQRLHLFSMVEGTRVFDEWMPMLGPFHTILVPSEENVKAWSPHHPNVRLALEGVDPADWHYIPRRRPAARFTFATGGTGIRKGGDITAEAFRRAFPVPEPGRPVPELLIRAASVDYPLPAGASVITSRLTGAEERDFYAAAHCWVQPSRGEGFGLMPLQAIGQGCPTILTDAHGHSSFAHLGVGVPAVQTKAGYFMFGDAEIVAAEWTWDKAAEQVLRIIGQPSAVPLGGLVKAPLYRYPVRVIRPWQAEVADTRYQFTPGETYWETADVKRVLAAAGALDPDCLGLGGLDEQMVAGASAAAGSCPACGQRLNGAGS